MTMTFDIDFNHLPDFVYIKTAGDASVKGFDKLLTNLVNSPQWKPGIKQLIDHRKLQAKHLTAENIDSIKNVVIAHRAKLGHGKCAFVIKDDLGFGLIRMYQMLGGDDIHQEMEVFYNFEKAVEWIKLKVLLS